MKSPESRGKVKTKGNDIEHVVAQSLEELGEPLPKLVAFDLEYVTQHLWHLS